MTRKVYQDYLTHLDAYLLNGVSEIGGHLPQNIEKDEIQLTPAIGNLTTDLFIIHSGPAYHNSVSFLSEDESDSLLKILSSINKNFENTYITCIHKTDQLNQQELRNLINKEIEMTSARTLLCLGLKTLEFLTDIQNKSYKDLDQWDQFAINNKSLQVVTIPSLSEMKADPSLKRPAWEQLKKLK